MGATASTFTTSTMASPSFVSIQTQNNNNQFLDQSSAVNNNLGMFSGIFEQNDALLKSVTDTMTVDFLGIGGSRPARNLLEKHQNHHQQHHDLDQFAGARLQGLSHFQQHAALDKPMWKV
ncbi:hypothetical protein F3Y22_tig00116958pilonHSYRG00335 [Hibiscus syriacus]|uniref:Uncharacterized protein n=2 Tax=Hibiscus syriacus TaxID=106335 RepID=A0A6A2WM31_HIBSY|nr:hypothetical protein F3Y22_tig00116958pilonHSYRG00335 [Hibiscus syriacus]